LITVEYLGSKTKLGYSEQP